MPDSIVKGCQTRLKKTAAAASPVVAILLIWMLIITIPAQSLSVSPVLQGQKEELFDPNKIKGINHEGFVTPTLAGISRDDERIFFSLTGSLVGIEEAERLASVGRKTRLETGEYRAVGLANGSAVTALLELPGISVKLKPRPVPVDLGPVLAEENQVFLQTTAFKVKEAIGGVRAFNEVGATGAGVRVAVIDSGVDFGHPDLKDALEYVDRDGIREPLVLDADESQVLQLSENVANADGFLSVKGNISTVFSPAAVEVEAESDYFVGSIKSVSGTYRFGITHISYFLKYNIGVLLADPEFSGDYTAAYVDLNQNHDFTDDEQIGYFSDRTASADLDEDGFPDISLGLLGGFFFDAYSWFSFPPRVLPGWDRDGNYLSIFYDYTGHGTAVAGALASRGGSVFDIEPFGEVTLPGIAPGAKIVAIKGLWMGNINIAMLWAAGFDFVSGRLLYTGQPRVDIVNNSWEITNILSDTFAPGFDITSMVLNSLSSPGEFHDDFPGILFVQAAGNAGFGYGTVSIPSTASLALSVGDSTSTHAYANVSSYSSVGNFEDILAFSPRGPTATGEGKPEVVAPGDRAAMTMPVTGGGWGWFGGSSMAAPLAAGVGALVKEALGAASEDPQEIKRIIELSATDLGYSPLIQGSGRVDAFAAVSLAKMIASNGQGEEAYGQTILEVTTKQTMNNLSPILSRALSLQVGITFRSNLEQLWGIVDPLRLSIPDLTKVESSKLFMGRIAPGERSTVNLEVSNHGSSMINVTGANALKYSAVSKQTFRGQVSTESSITALNLDPSQFQSSDLTRFNLNVSFKDFDLREMYSNDFSYGLWVYYWTDENSNTVAEPEELLLLNYSILDGTTQEVTVGRSIQKFEGTEGMIRVQVEMIPSTLSLNRTTPFTLTVTSYERTIDPQIIFPRIVSTVSSGDKIQLNGELTVPDQQGTGPREGFVEISYQEYGKNETHLVPYTYMVVGSMGTLVDESSNELLLYDPGSVRGAFNWNWRYLSGDWRIYTVVVDDPSTFALEVEFQWSDPDTVVDVITIGPDGQYAGFLNGAGIGFGIWHLSSGRFAWHQTSNGTDPVGLRSVTFPHTNYIVNQYSYRLDTPAVFTVLIHEVLHGGSMLSEPISGTVKAHTSELMPTRITMAPGETVPATSSIRIPYEIAASPESPVFTDFSIRFLGITTTSIGAVPSTRDVRRPYAINTTISTDSIGLKVHAPSYIPLGDELVANVLIVSIPSLRTYVREFGGEVFEYRLSPLYYFQDWEYVRISFLPP